MKKAVLITPDPLFLTEQDPVQVSLTCEDYISRIELFRSAMKKHGIAIAVIYGDREHFANIDYLSAYDCRFEESLLILPVDGTPTILVGNEGMAYSYIVPYPINRVYYGGFSLQGQPRGKDENLAEILAKAGVLPGLKVGVCGYKYFDSGTVLGDPDYIFDVPMYIMKEIYRALKSSGTTDDKNVINITALLTGLQDGIRLKVYSAREIAMAEAAACRSAAVVQRLLKNLIPGITEYKLSEQAEVGFAPWSVFPMLNFGAKHVALGLRSPGDSKELAEGDPCGICYGIRGCLTARVGLAVKDEGSMERTLGNYLYPFYGKFFQAMCNWYETLHVGTTGNELHSAVHSIIGGPEFGVTLNVGHYTGADEWVNALSYAGSEFTVPDGAYMQADIIASVNDPVRVAICEDGVIVAGEKLREAVSKEYPEVWKRIEQRKEKMRTVIGINLADDVLPLSNMNAVMFPFMLNLGQIFGLG